MIILDATTEKLQLNLAGAITTNELQWTTSFVEVTTSSYTPINADGLSSGAGDVDIVGVPGGASTQRQIKQITVYNSDTVAATVTIKKDTSGTEKILCKIIIQSGDTLQYNDGEGFCVIQASGGLDVANAPAMGISAGTQSVSTGNVVFADSNNVSFGMSGSSRITASVGGLSVSFWEAPHAELNLVPVATNSTVANSSMNISLQRQIFPYNMVVTKLDQIVALTVGGSTAGSWTISAGVYTRTQSTLNTASSTSLQYSWNSGGATNQSNSYSGNSGTRLRSVAPQSWVFTPGEYWFAFGHSVQGPAGTTGSLSIAAQSLASVQPPAGLSNDVIGQYAVFSAGTAAFPATIHVTNLIYAGTAAASASVVYRQPYFRMLGTY